MIVAFVLMVELALLVEVVDADEEASDAIDGWVDKERFGGEDEGGEAIVGEDIPWMEVQPEMTKTSADQRMIHSASFWTAYSSRVGYTA